MFIKPNFEDLTMEWKNVKCKIWLSRFGWHFQRAQIWFDQKLIEKMQPFVPYKTGKFLSKINAANAGKYGNGEVVVAVPPQGRYLYPGVAPSGKPFKWTNPQTQPRWGTYTYMAYKDELLRGIRYTIVTGRYK